MQSESKNLIIGDWTMPEFEYLSNNKWIWTEKVDGTNIRVHWDGEKVSFGGRTDRAIIPKHLLEFLQKTFTADKMSELFQASTSATLFGEGYGVKIQKGHNYIPDGVGFCLFDARIHHWWILRNFLEEIADKFSVPLTPVVGEGTLQEAIEFVSGGFVSQLAHNRDYLAEGVVARPAVELKTRSMERLITKIKYCDFNR